MQGTRAETGTEVRTVARTIRMKIRSRNLNGNRVKMARFRNTDSNSNGF
jgi:hypothetical protein